MGFTWKWLYNTTQPPPQKPNITNISAVTDPILSKLGRFLGTYRKDSSCNGDICPGNISPDDNCSYQEYLSFYWPEFDQTFTTITTTTTILMVFNLVYNKTIDNCNFCEILLFSLLLSLQKLIINIFVIVWHALKAYFQFNEQFCPHDMK